MSHHRLLGGVAATALAIGGLTALAVPANAQTPLTGTTVTVTPASGLLLHFDTRATGHNEFLEDGLHVWTEGSGSSDKADGYIADDVPLAGLGEPSLDWTPAPGLPAIPGKQLVVDFDNDGTYDGILVGEPVYGNGWWLSNSSPQWVKDGAPHQGGGYGSPYYGTLVEWAAAFPNAQINYVGYSLGSGVHGDGVISQMVYGDTTYRFALGIGPCLASVDDATKTYTLTQDCSTFETINVPDGWTLDGAGYTIHAVEDATHPNFPGPVVLSATGTDDAAATMNVENLTIASQNFGNGNSGGTLAGIRYNRAGGSVSDVTIQGISHGNGVQEGIGLYVRNRDAGGSTAVPAANITVDNLTVTRYQKGGVVLDGNLGFTMSDSTVGSAAAADGTPLTTLAANAVQISRSAHGTLTDSQIGLNEYDPTPPPGDGSDATSLLLYDAGSVTIARNVISGADGDVGMDAYNDTSGAVSTVVNASCNLFSRSETAGDYDPYGVGVAQWDDGSTPVTMNLSDSAFTGWNHDTASISYDGDDMVFGTGATNQSLGACAPNAPTGVTAPGGDQQTDVSWSPATGPAYTLLTGYTVSALGSDDQVVASQDVDADTTTAHLSGLTSGEDYTISVVAHGTGGDSVAGTAILHATSLTLTTEHNSIVTGKHTTIEGTLSSTDESAVLGGRTVTLQKRPAGSSGSWTTFTTVSTSSTGGFSTSVSPSANTEYRAVYAGNPDLSGVSSTLRVGVTPKVKIYVPKKRVKLGKKLVVSGTITPFAIGEGVQLEQRMSGGVWTDVTSSTVAADGSFVLRYKTIATGNPVFRVACDGDATHDAGKSRSFTVTVH
jgi:hypothetical protein